MAAGSVYLVPVPIGNLGDITLRALETLKRVKLIAAEDTRNTRFLLSHYQIPYPRILSLHKYNEKSRGPELLEQLEAGLDIAVVSDAGSPGISDPAMLFVQLALSHGIRVEALPGATALIPALTASGLDCSLFQFLGFLPVKGKARTAALSQIRDYPYLSVVYEAPHRLRKSLEDIYIACGDRKVCIAREISKLYEEYVRGTLKDIVQDYQITEKGEFVLILEGKAAQESADPAEVESFIQKELEAGTGARELATRVSGVFGLNRNQAYALVLAQKRKYP